MRNKVGVLRYRCIIDILLKSFHKSNIVQAKCKNNKLCRLISQKAFKQHNNILVVNSSSDKLDVKKLRYGLDHSYTYKNYNYNSISRPRDMYSLLNKSYYIKNVNVMTDDGKGKSVETLHNTHQNLKHFQKFLYRHYYKTEYYNKMHPISNKPAHFFSNAKTHLIRLKILIFMTLNFDQ